MLDEDEDEDEDVPDWTRKARNSSFKMAATPPQNYSLKQNFSSKRNYLFISDTSSLGENLYCVKVA